MARTSTKRLRLAANYNAFVLAIKARDGWRCRYCGQARGPLDPHHVLKPRARYLMDPDAVVTLCRRCHDRCEGPFAKGRLIVEPMGHGSFRYEVVYARSKQHARRAGLIA
jgi:hypothetical protein